MRPTAARSLALLGLVVLISLLTGCGEPSHATLRFGLASAPVTLDPRFATDATSARIDQLLYRHLVDFDQHFEPVPDLASWRQLAPDHYRFTLGADGRRFHDGSRLTAADVKATYDYILDPAHASPHRETLAMIRDIRVMNDDTVDFYLSAPDPLFPGRLEIGILPAKQIAAGRAFNHDPLGSYHHADRIVVCELPLRGPFHIVPDWLYFRREYPDRSYNKSPAMRDRCAILDPARANRLRHPAARLLAEYMWGYLAAVRHAPLPTADRRECYRQIALWALDRVSCKVRQRPLQHIDTRVSELFDDGSFSLRSAVAGPREAAE